MTSDSPVFLVIVTRNHASSLPAVVQSALAAGYELLVIDDGSDDDSLGTIAGLPCRTMRFAAARGHRSAVLEGAALAAQLGFESMVTMAGDGRHDPLDIRLLVEEAKRQDGACLVVGSPSDSENSSAGRNFHIADAHFWIRLECGLEIPDPTSVFRLYPVKELLALKFSLGSGNFATESIVRFAWSGLPVVAVPVAVGPPAEREQCLAERMKQKLSLISLHCRLVARRLLPLPHQRFVPEDSLHRKVVDTISQNPFRVLGRICREHTSPLWLALAVWLGIFMGALPLFSIHTIAIIYVAHRLHVNKVAAVAASQFCMPPVVPVLCIQVGYYLRKGELLLDFSWQRWLLEIHERFWEWLIGSLLLGPLLGLIGAGIIYWMAVRLQRKSLSSAG